MAKVSAIETELLEATGVKPKAKEKRQAFLGRLHTAVSELTDAAWEDLSTPAQKWANAASTAYDADKELPDFAADKEAPASKKGAVAEEDDTTDGEDDAEEADDTETSEDEDMNTKTPAKKGAKKAAKQTPAPAKKTAKKEAAPAKKAKKAVAGKPGSKGDGYKGHRSGSNKETVHKVYDEKGRDAAFKKAAALGLAENTARSWASSWGPSAADKAKK